MIKVPACAFLLLLASCVSWAQPSRCVREDRHQAERQARSLGGRRGGLAYADEGRCSQAAGEGVPPRPEEQTLFARTCWSCRLGSAVLFPNEDPFFHNVFSVYEGTRFDLGLYESGSSKEVRFNRPGPSYIFCNIHPEMSAVIMVMTTPYYATTDADGRLLHRRTCRPASTNFPFGMRVHSLSS